MDINRIPAYFRVLFESQTWRNIAYLFVAFPTGLLYFTLISIGLSLAGSLLIIGIGFLILIATGIGMLAAGEFERKLSNELLGTEIPPLPATMHATDGFTDNIRAMLSVSMIRVTFYLCTKFVFGIFALVAAIVAVAIPFSMLIMPLVALDSSNGMEIGMNEINTLPEALVVMLIGLLISPLFLHGTNLMTNIWRLFAEMMLGPTESEAEAAYDYDSVNAKRKNQYVETFDDDVYIAKPKRSPESVTPAQEPPVYSQALVIDDNDETPKRSLGDLVRRTMESEQDSARNTAKS